jgi:YHS domain-containing protein
MMNDPVCGAVIDEYHAAARIDYLGKTYFFCSSECEKHFAAHLRNYAQSLPRQSPAGRMKPAHDDPRRSDQ